METIAKVTAWGGSVGIRIPKKFLDIINLHDKESVTIRVTESNELLITPIRQKKTLAQLFDEYPADFIQDEELDWGQPVGGEVW